MSAVDIDDVVCSIDFYLQSITKELAKGGDQIPARQLTRLWMDFNKVHSALSKAKTAAQERDWKEYE